MEIVFFILNMVFGLLGLVPQPADLPAEGEAEVLYVVDGDTIDVFYNSTTTRVRYIGIDTPEPYRDGEPACFSKEATARNKELVAGKTVTLVVDKEDKDKYGRLLRYVYVDDIFINQVLVEEGYATPLPIKPNTSYALLFKDKASEANEKNLGLWQSCR